MFCGLFLSVCGFVLVSISPFPSVYFVMEAESFELLVVSFLILSSWGFFPFFVFFLFLFGINGSWLLRQGGLV